MKQYVLCCVLGYMCSLILYYSETKDENNRYCFCCFGTFVSYHRSLYWIVCCSREAMMGDVGRILYVHVPTAWVALLTYLIAFVVGIGSLWTGKKGWDATLKS